MELPLKTLDGFELMRLFVRIAETGSLSAAAQSLAISQPTASRQLKQLEQLLGAQLVRRSTHELTLTDSGNRFLEDARAMLAHWETSLDTLRNERRELTGSIRVAVPVAVGQTILATIASRFLVRHPAVTIDWRLTDQPGDLVAGGYDLWLRAGPIRQLDLIVRHLWRVARTIVAAKGFAAVAHPKALENLPSVVLFTFVPDEVLADRAAQSQGDAEDQADFQNRQHLRCDRSRAGGGGLCDLALLGDPKRSRRWPPSRNLSRMASARSVPLGGLSAFAIPTAAHQRLRRLPSNGIAESWCRNRGRGR